MKIRTMSENQSKQKGLGRQVAAVLMLPFVMTVILPMTLLLLTKSKGWGVDFPIWLLPVTAGFALILGGLTLFWMTVRMFGQIGEGTLAPWDPTQKLVVVGVYRHVRNPMITGVASILVGETLVFGSGALLIFALIFMAVNAVYIPLSEEPGLVARFGQDYEVYRRHVPRWLPRRRAWEGTDSAE